MTGIGPVAVRQTRVRYREADATDPDASGFSVDPAALHAPARKSIERCCDPLLKDLHRRLLRGSGGAARKDLPVVGIRHRRLKTVA